MTTDGVQRAAAQAATHLPALTAGKPCVQAGLKVHPVENSPSPPPGPPPHPARELPPCGKPATAPTLRLPTGLGKPLRGFPQLPSPDDDYEGDHHQPP